MVTSMPAAIESEWPAVIPWENPTYTLMQGDTAGLSAKSFQRPKQSPSNSCKYGRSIQEWQYENLIFQRAAICLVSGSSVFSRALKSVWK